MSKWKIRVFVLALIIFILNFCALYNSSLVEKYYSKGIYRLIAPVISQIIGFIPISVAEVLLLAIVSIFLGVTIKVILGIVKNRIGKLEAVKSYIVNIVLILCIIYSLFICVWGLNYNRDNLSKIFGLEVKPSPVEELLQLNKALEDKAAKTRNYVGKNDWDVAVASGDYKSVFERAGHGYKNATLLYEELGGVYGKPKGVMLSKFMSYTGIWGIYSPFTAEANVNVSIPSFMLPSTACHEMAHQRGFAREDEANYISYLVCSMHPDADFKYSGYISALISTMNALHSSNYELYRKFYSQIDEGIKKDLKELNEFNKIHDGKIQKAATKTNDIYLKANNQKDGEKSYGRVVDWLLAEYRQKGVF